MAVNGEIHQFGTGDHQSGACTLTAMQNRPNRVRQLREAAGLTLEQLAEAADTSAQQVSRLEKGERRLTDEWLGRLSRALGCRKADLLYDAPTLASPQPGVGDNVENDVERDLLTFWRSLGAEYQDVILDLMDVWAERRTRRTGTH